MVGDNGESVMYPMPIAWGATFDDGLVFQASAAFVAQLFNSSSRLGSFWGKRLVAGLLPLQCCHYPN